MYNSMLFPNLEPLTHQENAVVEENANLVRRVMEPRKRLISFSRSVYDDEDWFSIGVLALCAAAKTFRPEKGAAFSTYAYWVIHNQFSLLNKYIDKKGLLDETSGHRHVLSGGEETSTTILDVIPSDSHYFAEDIIDSIAVQQAYNALTPEEKQIVDLNIIDGLSLRNIEKEIGIGRDTCRKILKRALTKMEMRLK